MGVMSEPFLTAAWAVLALPLQRDVATSVAHSLKLGIVHHDHNAKRSVCFMCLASTYQDCKLSVVVAEYVELFYCLVYLHCWCSHVL